MIIGRFAPVFLLSVLPLALTAHSIATQRIDASRIVAQARSQVDAQLGEERSSAEVTVIGAPEDVMVPAGNVTLALHELKGRWPRSRVGIPVDVLLDGRVVRSATVWFAIDLQRHILEYATDGINGTAAGSLNLVPATTDVARLQGTPLGDIHDVQGMRLRHPVGQGNVAVREDFEATPDVDSREHVKILVAVGTIQMEAQGTAMSKGNAGDVVSVLVNNAEGPVRARVMDKGVVKVVQ